MGRVKLLSLRQRELHNSRDLSPAVSEVARHRSPSRGHVKPSHPPEVFAQARTSATAFRQSLDAGPMAEERFLISPADLADRDNASLARR